MRIRWTAPAAADLEQIKAYLDEHYPHLAQRTIRILYDSIRSLKTMPNRARVGLRSGTRELIMHPLPYLVVYRVKEDAVEILHIVHRDRDFGNVAPIALPTRRVCRAIPDTPAPWAATTANRDSSGRPTHTFHAGCRASP
jgi:toxin ParE1/3/4